jgi:SpoU rRNA methylase family enzyme
LHDFKDEQGREDLLVADDLEGALQIVLSRAVFFLKVAEEGERLYPQVS